MPRLARQTRPVRRRRRHLIDPQPRPAGETSQAAARLLWLAAALGLVAAAIWLRTSFLGERQLFRDEAASWLLAGYPLPDLLRHAAGEPYPPLYAFLLGGWIQLATDSEAALRAPSVLAGLGMVAVGWRWAHEALGRWAGLVALAVLALSPLALANARDARMYALETLFTTLSWWLVWRLISGRTPRGRLGRHGLALGLSVGGQLWTLSLGLPMAGLQALVAIAALAADRLRGVRLGESGAAWALAGLVGGGLLFLPWLPPTLALAVSGESFWTPTPDRFAWYDTFRQMVIGYRSDLWWLDRGAQALLYGAVAGAVAAAATPDRRRLGWCLLAGLAFVPLVWAYSQIRSIYDPRYLVASLAPLALGVAALAGSLAALDRRLMAAVAAAVLLVMAPAARLWLDGWREAGGLAPTRQVVDALEARLRPGDVLLASDARSYFPLAYELSRRADGGRPLPAPLYDWDSGTDPFFLGHSLIAHERRVTEQEAAAGGWRGALPGLTGEGSIWLVTLAHDRNENLGFAPLEDGRLREQERIVVEPVDEAGQARRLQPVR